MIYYLPIPFARRRYGETQIRIERNEGRSRASCSGAHQHLQDSDQHHLPPEDGHHVRHAAHRDEDPHLTSPAAQACLGHLSETEGSVPLLKKVNEALRRLLLPQQHPAWEGTLRRTTAVESRGSLSHAGTCRQYVLLFRCHVTQKKKKNPGNTSGSAASKTTPLSNNSK
ncbi:hypothetical protein E2C01_025298 [Portunus trituberculatus]|uniref:Uncharacterized protein n=1 Tax=Portunus trituberculatus TaxID=210409 RepID=A0A5B7EFL7_PORTR|nr:hypothetical protein [Portunus trituberculatus]